MFMVRLHVQYRPQPSADVANWDRHFAQSRIKQRPILRIFAHIPRNNAGPRGGDPTDNALLQAHVQRQMTVLRNGFPIPATPVPHGQIADLLVEDRQQRVTRAHQPDQPIKQPRDRNLCIRFAQSRCNKSGQSLFWEHIRKYVSHN